MLGDYFGSDTYKSKDVITYAADAIVYINGVGTKIVSPINNKLRKVSFQDDIMTISTNLTIDGAGSGSASLSLTVPRHSEKQYFKYGHCVIKPMMEVEIYFKGRFLTDSGSPVYYPAYWGLVTDVSVDYSGGQHTIDVQCLDILFFWSRSMITTNGSIFTPAWDPEAQKTEYVNIFNHMTPHEIILALAFVVHGTLTTPDVALVNKEDGGVRSRGIFQTENIKAAAYWEARNKAMARRLKLFGLSGNSNGIKEINDGLAGTVKEYDTDLVLKVVEEIKRILPAQGKKGMKRNETMFARAEYYKSNKIAKPLSLDGNLFNTFYPFNGSSQNTDSEAGESESKLEMANKVKETINFEFFLDTTGDIIFKPPFYNMDVRTHDPISIIRDEDIISFTYTEDAKGIVTRIDAMGAWTTYDEGGDLNSMPYGAYIDYALAREYGIVKQELKRSFLKTDQLCVAYAIGELSRINADRFTSSMTIIGRPELRLGYPVYIKSIDTFYYVTGISHSYTATGKMETSLELKGARRKYIQYDKVTGKVLAGADLINNSGRSPKLSGVRNVVLTSDPYSILEEMNAFIRQGEEADEEFKQLKLIVERDKKVNQTEDSAIKDTEKKLKTLWKKTQTDIANLEKELRAEESRVQTKLKPFSNLSALEVGAPAEYAQKIKAAKAKLIEESKIKELQEKIKALQTERARQTKEFDRLKAKSSEERKENSEQSERLKKEFDYRVKEQARARELRRSAERAVTNLSSSLVTQVGGTNIDPISQGILKVTSAYKGIEFQTFGRTIEMIKPGQLHADLSFIPVSDEFGYEVVGGFGYGRGNALYTNWRIRSVIPYSITTYTTVEDKKNSNQPGIVEVFKDALDPNSAMRNLAGSPSIIGGDYYNLSLATQQDAQFKAELGKYLRTTLYTGDVNEFGDPQNISNRPTSVFDGAVNNFLNNRSGTSTILFKDPKGDYSASYGGLFGAIGLGSDPFKVDVFAPTPYEKNPETAQEEYLASQIASQNALDLAEYNRQWFRAFIGSASDLEAYSSFGLQDQRLVELERVNKANSDNLEKSFKSLYGVSYGSTADTKFDTTTFLKGLSKEQRQRVLSDTSLFDTLNFGDTSSSFKEKISYDVTRKIWYRNIDKEQEEQLKKTLNPGEALKTVSVRNWTNPDLTVPDDSPDIHNAEREDLATGPLFVTPGNTSVYSGVGVYLTDFYSIPSLTGPEVQAALKAETDHAISDSKKRSGYKDDLDEMRKLLAASKDPDKLKPIPDPTVPPPSKVDANKAQTGAGVAGRGGGRRRFKYRSRQIRGSSRRQVAQPSPPTPIYSRTSIPASTFAQRPYGTGAVLQRGGVRTQSSEPSLWERGVNAVSGVVKDWVSPPRRGRP